ncbi:TetR/AcrR family transcriptional regulator C-terminal domain-containing protein [Mycobacterium sp. 21AC1]|uniref:TetR/AcrR family transcriptional regulator n=1 Tax=[Mycobacterium] appelbergii TaxID=2939269 RepID=UPI00293922E9|nr:TetR/AcrR family transcriptional regulator C-terminal domain-containing protein [Mycobacterium sp. 21AC1]MDV3125241.1 TetR/AcrR family transcriptional regulator C-terminal domain-containing protein [Mycobacterium sp. 21AC1]
MPRPRSFSQDQVAAAALAVVDADGLAGLSMRTVARQLGIATMSVYRYVADRDELEVMLVDLLLGGVDLEVPRGSAAHRLTVLAERVRDAAEQHPAAMPLLLAHRHRAPTSLRWGEAVLGVLTDAGCTGRRRVYAFRALLAYVFGALEVQRFGALGGAGTHELAQLAAERYPLLSQAATLARGIDPREEFRGGLEVLLRGLGL